MAQSITSGQLFDMFQHFLEQYNNKLDALFFVKVAKKDFYGAVPFAIDNWCYHVIPILDKYNRLVKLTIKVNLPIGKAESYEPHIKFRKAVKEHIEQHYGTFENDKYAFSNLRQYYTPYILKFAYPTRTDNSILENKSDVQSTECHAIASMLDDAAIHENRACVIVNDAIVGAKAIKHNKIVCNIEHALNDKTTLNDKNAVLYVVCSMQSKNDKELYAQHKQLLESFKGTIIWLYYDLRLAPQLDDFKLSAKQLIICTQAEYVSSYIVQLIQKASPKYCKRNSLCIKTLPLHAIPLYYHQTNNVDNTKVRSERITVSYPMVAWNDMGANRQKWSEELFHHRTLETHVCGNINGMPFDIDKTNIVYEGTIKCSDIIEWNKKFDIAYIIPEQYMIDCKVVTFRAIEAMMAGVIAAFVHGAIAPDKQLFETHDANSMVEALSMHFSQEDLDRIRYNQGECLEQLHKNAISAWQSFATCHLI